MKIVIGISGASGAPYAIRVLQALHELGHESHLVVSHPGRGVLRHECRLEAEALPATALYDIDDIAAPIASGSFRIDAMAVVPCSMRTLGAVASGTADNLLCRAADVCLKEGRHLSLIVRESPLSAIHLENMLRLARAGARIVPACPAFYHAPESLQDMVDMMAGKVLDSLGVDNDLYQRWQGTPGLMC